MATRDEWARRVARWQKSGLTATEFAAREGLKASTLTWWRAALRRAQARPSTEVDSAPTFVEIEAVELAVPTCAPIEVALSNGRIVRVPATFDDAALQRVLQIAERR